MREGERRRSPEAVRSSDRKAVAAARRLASTIAADGWSVGRRLGTESELMARLGVGRKTFREAIRILEQQSVVRSGSGQAGGFFVGEPALEAFSNSLRNFIEISGCSLDDVLVAYEPIMRLLIDRALARMTPGRANDLRRSLDEMQAPVTDRLVEARHIASPLLALGEAAGDPCLTSLVHMLHKLVADFSHQDRCPDAFWQEVAARRRREMAALIDQVIRKDPQAYETLAAMHEGTRSNLAALQTVDARIWNSASFLHGAFASTLEARDGPRSAALILSYRIASDIALDGSPPGARLGAQAEIALKYGVSVRTAGEAIRLLEFLGRARPLRGRSTGIEVTAPDPAYVVEMAGRYLSAHAPARADLTVLKARLEQAAAGRIAANMSHRDAEAALDRVTAALDRPSDKAKEDLAAARREVLGLTSSPVVALIITVLAGALDRSETDALTPARRQGIEDAAATVRNALRTTDGEGLEGGFCMLLRQLGGAAVSVEAFPSMRPSA
nr:GntR family transcriptional regulator [uncultured Brevundimonas sp.]